MHHREDYADLPVEISLRWAPQVHLEFPAWKFWGGFCQFGIRALGCYSVSNHVDLSYFTCLATPSIFQVMSDRVGPPSYTLDTSVYVKHVRYSS